MKEFTPQDLSAYNGKNGQPAYVAYNGKVYDVSGSELWAGGEHEFMHQAGADLSQEMFDAPHEEEVFSKHPQVGIMKAP